MIRNNSVKKNSDFLKDDFKSVMDSYFNPYEYNLESNTNYDINKDQIAMKSKSHSERNLTKRLVK